MPRQTLLRLAVGAAALGLLAGCSVEDRTPTGSRQDEDAARAVVAEYYRMTSAQDWPAVRATLWDSATVAVRPAPGAEWYSFGAPDPFVKHLGRSLRGLAPGELGPRLIRTDFRQADGLVSLWVTTRLEQPQGGAAVEVEHIDHFVLRRFAGGAWRIVHLVSVPGGAGARQ